MPDTVKYLLLQVRDREDPMRLQEVGCFSRALHCPRGQIEVVDLLDGVPHAKQIDEADIVLIGGSGNYSVVTGGPWLPPALDAMRLLYETSKPTFASCWGFQAMSVALGGEVVTDLSRAEVGTNDVYLTDAGRKDPIFGSLDDPFRAQMGHQDIVVQIPIDATLLASSDRVTNQAYCFPDKHIYCTQFHPELNRRNLLERVDAYPEYVERIAGVPMQEFIDSCQDTPEAEALLLRFVKHFLKQ